MYKKPVLAFCIIVIASINGCNRKPTPVFTYELYGLYECDVTMHDVKVADLNTWNIIHDSLIYKDTILLSKGEANNIILHGAYLPVAICTKQSDGNYIGHGISGGDTCTWQLNTYPHKDSITLMFATQRRYKTVTWNRVGKRIKQ